MSTCSCQTADNLWKCAFNSVLAEELHLFHLICIQTFRFKPTLEPQCLCLCFCFCALMTALFSASHPSNSWFSSPPTDLDDISAERRGSLCLNGAFLFWASLPWASTLWALLASALLGGGPKPLFEKGPEDTGEISRALKEAFLISVWQHGKEEQPERYVSALFTLVQKNPEYLLQNYNFHVHLTDV